MYTTKPNKEEWDKYEGKKDTFMDNLYNKLLAQAEQREKKEKKLLLSGKVGDVRKFSKRELEVMRLKNKKNMKQKEIAEELGVVPSRITAILQNIKRKVEITKENG